ncbi:predicted protein [Pyrenophora tritici-repentis Pt-1C-BFP]|uniref:Uncharacterized protein n=1 Tax=Pyrenophora tritici-repentis (strain Pt-1C-BFP) TaxID=426418 RepID=B2W9U9_PYRTR|nr:uncharacterized protein PTRG_06757 [Pyrenophora tritici-repentis Pt-1C-BFP]EDU49677.1 predicted protein [Pyrenophora tritici-repentis Pt-1C-BFP]
MPVALHFLFLAQPHCATISEQREKIEGTLSRAKLPTGRKDKQEKGRNEGTQKAWKGGGAARW